MSCQKDLIVNFLTYIGNKIMSLWTKNNYIILIHLPNPLISKKVHT